MIEVNDKLYMDFEAVRKIPVIPQMLEIICQTTGMGFAAVARVTEDRWLACRVLDSIKFGLKEGEELKVETTICNEIRGHKCEVVIDHVEEDEQYRGHHTAVMYGFQSYISYPILLKNGDFFGTLCAIDPHPAKLKNPKVMGTFKLFAELLSFHLQSLDLVDRSQSALQETNRKLDYAHGENIQYKHITNHNLKEQLRKISVFSDILLNQTKAEDLSQIKKIAFKINSFAQELTSMLERVAEFSELNDEAPAFESVDLNRVLSHVSSRLDGELAPRKELVITNLPTIEAVPGQMEQLFYQLISYFAAFAREDRAPVIRIYENDLGINSLKSTLPTKKTQYSEILMEIDYPEIGKYVMENIFDIFVHSNNELVTEKYSTGLALCQKIVHYHGGQITAKSTSNDSALISITISRNKDFTKAQTPAGKHMQENLR